MHILILVLGVQTWGGRKPLASERGGRAVCFFEIDSKVCLLFHGQRSLAGYSPWSCKELDMTE